MSKTKTKIQWNVEGADISIDGGSAVHYDGKEAMLELDQGNHTISIVASNGASKTLNLNVPEAIADKIANEIAQIGFKKYYYLKEIDVENDKMHISYLKSDVSKIKEFKEDGTTEEIVLTNSILNRYYGINNITVQKVEIYNSDNILVETIDVTSSFANMPECNSLDRWIKIDEIKFNHNGLFMRIAIDKAKEPIPIKARTLKKDGTYATYLDGVSSKYTVDNDIKRFEVLDENDNILDFIDLEFKEYISCRAGCSENTLEFTIGSKVAKYTINSQNTHITKYSLKPRNGSLGSEDYIDLDSNIIEFNPEQKSKIRFYDDNLNLMYEFDIDEYIRKNLFEISTLRNASDRCKLFCILHISSKLALYEHNLSQGTSVRVNNPDVDSAQLYISFVFSSYNKNSGDRIVYSLNSKGSEVDDEILFDITYYN